MQKAFKWLDAHKIAYTFYDYKIIPPTEMMVKEWLKQIPIETLVNIRSTTYKNLNEAEKMNIMNPAKCMAIIQENPSILKRPLLDVSWKYVVGFEEELWSRLFVVSG